MVAKKAGAVKSKKDAKARAKKAAIAESKQEQEQHPAEAMPVSEGKIRSLLHLKKKDEKPQDKLSASKKEKTGKPAVAKKEIRPSRSKEKPKKSFLNNTVRFFQGVWGELKKVHWPGARELAGYSIVVIVAVIIVAGLIWVADLALSQLIQLLLAL